MRSRAPNRLSSTCSARTARSSASSSEKIGISAKTVASQAMIAPPTAIIERAAAPPKQRALAWSLDEPPQRGDSLGEAVALGAAGDEPGHHGAYGNGIGDAAGVAGVHWIDLPVARVLSKQAVRASLGEMPFHPSPSRIRILLHIEAERDWTDGDAVMNDHVALVRLDHVGRGDPRVVARMTAIVHDDAPHLLR